MYLTKYTDGIVVTMPCVNLVGYILYWQKYAVWFEPLDVVTSAAEIDLLSLFHKAQGVYELIVIFVTVYVAPTRTIMMTIGHMNVSQGLNS